MLRLGRLPMGGAMRPSAARAYRAHVQRLESREGVGDGRGIRAGEGWSSLSHVSLAQSCRSRAPCAAAALASPSGAHQSSACRQRCRACGQEAPSALSCAAAASGSEISARASGAAGSGGQVREALCSPGQGRHGGRSRWKARRRHRTAARRTSPQGTRPRPAAGKRNNSPSAGRARLVQQLDPLGRVLLWLQPCALMRFPE